MASKDRPAVNNTIYDGYGERWYTAENDPVALLRAETRARNPWITAEIEKRFAGRNVRLLDIGCGAGFLTNELAQHDFQVTDLDTSESSLVVAHRHDPTDSAGYCRGDAYRLGFKSRTFDAVFAMDFLEHLEKPEDVVGEVARVLKDEGLFFFYTFSRNPISWLIVIKGVEWFVQNTPPDMHRLRCFIKPAELSRMCSRHGLEVELFRGFVPKLFNRSFWKMLATGKVDEGLAFKFTRHKLIGYVGLASKRPNHETHGAAEPQPK